MDWIVKTCNLIFTKFNMCVKNIKTCNPTVRFSKYVVTLIFLTKFVTKLYFNYYYYCIELLYKFLSIIIVWNYYTNRLFFFENEYYDFIEKKINRDQQKVHHRGVVACPPPTPTNL